MRVRVANKLSEGITIQFDYKTLTVLRNRTSEKGIGPTTFIRMWVLGHLKTA